MELSKTEFRVSALVGSGFEFKEIANKMHRSYHTVACHIKNIRIKNKLKNVSEITREFVLEFGDPRQYIAMILLSVQLSIVCDVYDDELRRPKRTKIAKVKSKTARKYNG